jgi:hypothetical protein
VINPFRDDGPNSLASSYKHIAPGINAVICGLLGVGAAIIGIANAQPFAILVVLAFAGMEIYFVRSMLRNRKAARERAEKP